MTYGVRILSRHPIEISSHVNRKAAAQSLGQRPYRSLGDRDPIPERNDHDFAIALKSDTLSVGSEHGDIIGSLSMYIDQ